jgi:two-component system KDP operon response regulator KdpE
LSDKTILIIEDDPDVRRGMQIRFNASQYSTCFASDGVSAIVAARKHNPDVIILDLGLPAGDGFVVLERLKNIRELANIPVIVVSARDTDPNRERAVRAGANAYLQKPVDNAELLSVIRRVLGELQDEPAIYEL